MRLSERIRPDVEAAPWVIKEIKQLEQELDLAKKEVAKLHDRIHELLEDSVLNKGVIDSLAVVVKRLDSQCDAAERWLIG